MLSFFLLFQVLFFSPLLSKEEIPPVFTYSRQLDLAIEAAKEGGAILLQYWNRGIDLETEMKGDTPVTIADLESNRAICEKLIKAFPDYGLLTEENITGKELEEATSRWNTAEWTWVVDPLDGTKSFISGRREFGIHVGLLHFGKPVVGVNHYPVTKTTYFGVDGCGAYKKVKNKSIERIRTEKKAKITLPVISSRKSAFVRSFYTRLFGLPITDKMLRKDFKVVASCGLRICLIAEGKRNIYASKGESGGIWDCASGSVILKEAGGFISDLKGEPLDYLSPNFKFESGMLFCGSKDLFEKALKSSL